MLISPADCKRRKLMWSTSKDAIEPMTSFNFMLVPIPESGVGTES